MAIIVPAILESEMPKFQERLAAIGTFENLQRAQIDFSDGKFTPFKTVTAEEIKSLPAAIAESAVFWEAHLMVENPQNYFADLKSAGFKMVIIHFESVPTGELAKIAEVLRQMQLVPGLAISPQTAIAETSPYLKYFEQVTLLTVVPGRQGESMDLQAPVRVAELVKACGLENPAAHVEIDGGVNAENLKQFLGAGVEYIVIGSAIFKNQEASPDQSFSILREQASS
jgi:ribulose-phosphate 3-epimerase